MELAGAVLARTEVKLMLVKGAMETPEFLLPVDALMLVPGQGTYTCCAKMLLT